MLDYIHHIKVLIKLCDVLLILLIIFTMGTLDITY